MSELVGGALDVVKEFICIYNLVAIPFLLVVGNKLKRSRMVSDELIPRVLSYIGVAVALVFGVADNSPDSVVKWVALILTSIGQGYMISLFTVGLHQYFKQRKLYDTLSSYDGSSTSKFKKMKKKSNKTKLRRKKL